MFNGKLCVKRLTLLVVAYACGLIQAYLMQTHHIHWWVAGALILLFIFTAIDSWDKNSASGPTAADPRGQAIAPSSHPGTSRSPA